MGAGELHHKASAMRNQADFSHWCCWAPILSLSVSPYLSLPATTEPWYDLGEGFGGLLIRILSFMF